MDDVHDVCVNAQNEIRWGRRLSWDGDECRVFVYTEQ